MATREQLGDWQAGGWFHCVSRCVRLAYLCGTDPRSGQNYEHRREWIGERLGEISRLFHLGIAAYAVMNDHLHLVLRCDPQVVADWSDEDVVRRWLDAFPSKRKKGDAAQMSLGQVIAEKALDGKQVATWRQRLGDLGWFMRALREPISRRANREDGCGGAFWEARFPSVSLLDQAALIGCMAYVDLHPIRAGAAARPERWESTSVQQRLGAGPAGAPKLLAMKHCLLAEQARPISRKDYLTLIAETGRLLRSSAKRRRSAALVAILDRLGFDLEPWLDGMAAPHQMLGRAVGGKASRLAEADRVGLRRIQNHSLIFAPDAPPAS